MIEKSSIIAMSDDACPYGNTSYFFCSLFAKYLIQDNYIIVPAVYHNEL